MIYAGYDLLMTLPMLYGVISLAGAYLRLDTVGALEYLISGLYIGIMCGLRHLEMKFRIAIGASLFVTLGILAWFYQRPDYQKLLWKNQGYLWLFFVAVVCYLVHLLLEQIALLRILAAGGVLAGLAGCLVLRITIPHFGVCMWLVTAMLLFAEATQTGWKKEGFTDRKKHMVFLTPFFIIGCIIFVRLPYSEAPYDWQFVKNIITRISEQGIRISQSLFHRNDENYEAGFMGFSDQGVVSGDLSEGALEKIMEVQFSSLRGNRLYLQGVTFGEFDGRKWKPAEPKNGYRERMLDTLELFAAVEAIPGVVLSDYLVREDVRITFLKFSTQYVFAPPKAVVKSSLPGIGDINAEGALLRFTEKKGFKTEYHIPFYRINRDHDNVTRLLSDPQRLTIEAWQNAVMQLLGYDQDGVDFETYCTYEDLQKQYATLSVDGTKRSERMKAFLAELRGSGANDYEVLCNLERLLSGFSYTLSPGVMPSKIKNAEDFADVFLFEKREGYCSYYATEFVLIARMLGIPARYVQGFAVNKTTEEPVAVTSNDAHAWAECYFSGLGWIVFDPTPGMRTTTWWPSYEEQKQWAQQQPIQPPELQPQDPPAFEPELPELFDEEKKKETTISWRLLLAVSLGVVIVLAVLLAMDRMLAKRRYEKADEKARWKMGYRINLKLMERMGYSLEADRTLFEFYSEYKEMLPELFSDFIHDAERFFYAGQVPTAQELVTQEAFNRELLVVLKEKKRRKYLWCVLTGLKLPQRKEMRQTRL